jgi:CBS domain-containing protein
VTSTGKTAKADLACIGAEETLRQAGHLMRELGVGTLGVRGKSGEIQGIISRDMVVESIAAGGDPKTVTVGEVMSFRPARDGTPSGRPLWLSGPQCAPRPPAAVSCHPDSQQHALSVL